MTVLLSHRLDSHQPNWPGAPGLTCTPCHRMDKGDIANTHVLEIYNHYGSHCDLPYHFQPGGKTIDAVSVEDFVFSTPCVVDVPLGEDELLTEGHLAERADLVRGHDLLLLRSGFEANRHDIERYVHHGPGFTAGAARYLRSAFPGLRGIGIDWLSVIAMCAQDEGAEAHQVLLADNADRQFVVIFEDVRVSALNGYQPSRVYALPLFVAGLDGSPCTIVAETGR